MRLQGYLSEKSLDQYMKEASFVHKVHLKCLEKIKGMGWKSPDDIFKGVQKQEVLLYRGWSRQVDRTEHTQREDRKPVDSSRESQEIADEWFKKKFGWKPRSEGLLTSPLMNTAMGYAKGEHSTYMVFPKGSYKYVWSPRHGDFYVSFGIGAPHDIKQFHEKLEAAEYTDKNIRKIVYEEVMIKASSFTLINCLYYTSYCSQFEIKPNEKNIYLINNTL